jgi:hypothetical protein
MTHKATPYAAWAALAAIIFVTVSPIDLRPRDILPVDVDRAFAFAALALLFVLAYPRQWLWAGVVLVLGAGAIEMLQLLSPTRHATIDDAVVKATGALCGVLAAVAINMLRGRLSHSKRRSVPRRRAATLRPASHVPTEHGFLQPLAVQSRIIKTVYFSQQHGRLMIRFNNGQERIFEGVAEEEANALISAPSPGQHYIDNIRHRYRRMAA